ncbi:hypothetical protein WJX72_011401 [[Myrmecia] bisecta]|uniref:RING-type E3 ubiquitin transferase n=1 Tax=[Myrmecia] bisecta TaxID=41462 RepID=A0AAW1PYG2_9CHLO
MEHDALSEDGTEEVVCRICRMPDSEEEGKLYYPCNCKGSIKHVHQDCLNRWLTHSGHRHCELCKHEFSFTPVYREDAPMRLTWLELLSGLANKSATGLHFGLRLALVLLVWLVAVPLTTCWLWRLAFVRSFPHAVATISQRLKLIYLLSDCVQGSIISSILIFLVLVSTYVWDYVRMTYWQGRRRGRRVVQGAQRVPRVEDLAPVQEGPGRGVAGPDAWYLDRQRGVPALLRQQAEMQRERDAFRREHQALLDEAQALVDIAGGSAPQSAEDISLRQQQVQRISDRLAAARADPRFDSIAMEPYNFTGAGVGLAQRGTQLSPGQTTAAGRLLGTVADRNGAVDATTDTDSGSGSDSGNEPGDQGSEALSAPGDEPLEPHRGSDYLYPAQPITTNKRSKGLLRSPSAAASLAFPTVPCLSWTTPLWQ